MANQEDIKKIIAAHDRRLQKLQEQKALAGSNVDPKVLIEIEDVEKEIAALRESLEALKKASIQPKEEPSSSEPVTPVVVSSPRWQNLVGGIVIGLVGALLVLAFFPNLWPWSWFTNRLPTDLPTSPEALVYNFEDKISPEWRVGVGQAKLSQSKDYAFAGQYSLKADVELLERSDQRAKAGTVELMLEGWELQDKLVVTRVYAPSIAPTNLFAGLFIADATNQWRLGSGTVLPAGKWSTLVWSTQDALAWQSPAKLGIQFTLTPGSVSTDERAYKGPVYIDLVEVLALPTNISSPSLDHILQPLLFYDFEAITALPENISPIENTKTIELADQTSLPGVHGALQLNTKLIPYSPSTESGFGGIEVDLSKTEPTVDALSASVFIPAQESTRGGSFQMAFVAISDDEGWVYSGGLPVRVGEWTPYFWGTRYAYEGSNLCQDSDKDNQCDTPAGIWWHSWKNTKIKGFYFRIWRDDAGYDGPIYIDNLAAYQVKP